MRILVTGASGFIGNHLSAYLKAKGHWVRGVDWNPIKPWNKTEFDDFQQLDLRNEEYAFHACAGGIDEVYALAADMGGMGFISQHHVPILQNNMRININTLRAAHLSGVKNYFFASSACAYPEFLQTTTDNVIPLKESDAFPANPQDGYGWEKLMTEIYCHYYRKVSGMRIRIGRFHNIAGPNGEWRGGREKAPAALCRKIALAKILGRSSIDIWGDGSAVRSYCYIDDCLKGIDLLMHTDDARLDGYGINLGSDEAVTVRELANTIMHIAAYEVALEPVEGPVGVAGRNSDNTLIKSILGWCPDTPLAQWLVILFPWVMMQVKREFQDTPQHQWEQKALWVEQTDRITK